jgi:FkbM family methyltransferase
MRSLSSAEYRRAFRSFRNLPQISYRTVIDAGAHRGSFSDAFLQVHTPERLILVEPIPGLARQLAQRYRDGPAIEVAAVALAGSEGTATFDVNQVTAASSLLSIDPRNSGWFGRDLSVASQIQVETMSLPALMHRYELQSVDLLKLDLQGAERIVLEGAESVLARINVIYTEVFFEPLYAGCWLFFEVAAFLAARGFKLCALSNLAHGRNGDLLQGNAVFRRLAAPEL